MIIIEWLLGALFVSLSAMAVQSDLRFGIIRNKMLLFFLFIAALLDFIYYGFFAQGYLSAFMANVIIIFGISLILFYTHSFAGGDSKLAIVLAFCYPGGCYLSYGDTKITLIMAIAMAILSGYIYLLIYSLIKLSSNKTKWDMEYIKSFVFSFFRSYIIAMIYISLINVIAMLCYTFCVNINTWLIRLACMTVAWLVGKYGSMHKLRIVIPILFLDVLGSLYVGRLPFSVNPLDYLIVFLLLLCRMTITTGIYENVKTENLKKGMILSIPVTMLMQNSNIKGLPSLSTEDLKSRLSSNEVESVQEWAEKNGISEINIVKKIPFAVFLVAGYLVYFMIWCVL